MREAQRAENRRRFPEIAEFVEKLRKEGAEVKLVYAINRQGESIGPVPDAIRKEWTA